MDTSPGPIPSMDPAVLELGAQIAIDDGKDALKAALDAFAPLDSEAYQRLLEQRPGYQAYVDHKWNSLSIVMWAALARAIAHQSDDLALLGELAIPVLVLVGEQDEAFIAPSEAMRSTIPGARLVTIPDAGHSPQFENPDAWYAAMAEFVAAVPVD
jgi:pimeloyl-ACP methyl ester carboxylesterase